MKSTLIFFLIGYFSVSCCAQNSDKNDGKSFLPIVNFSSQQDRENMMNQLGIKTLRPGYSGDNKAPNRANSDQALANPFPNYPDPLIFNNGNQVMNPQQWDKRRAEIIEDFEREVYGRVPKNVPKVNWKVKVIDSEYIGFTPVIAKQLVGQLDNSNYPLLNVNIAMTLVLPANAKDPVPLLIMFGPSILPAPSQPNREDLELINHAVKDLLIKSNPELKAIFEKYPAYQPIASQNSRINPISARPIGDPPTAEQLIAAGWGYLLLDPTSIQADSGAELTKGIIGLTNKGQPRKPEDWGALRAWAWGASQAFDYLSTEPKVNIKKVGIEGVSRYGKAALVTMAFDQRFAIGLIASSGQGGTKPARRNFGEAVENLAGGAHYWMAGNYLKYAADQAKFGSKNANDIPVESNQLIALCAPRLTFISHGAPSMGDSNWLDHQGSYMATVSAGKVYKLLGAKDIGVSNDYKIEKMPSVNTGLLEGKLAWRQHDGGHTDAPNIKYFIQWANKFL
ncbi:glucuronyl esterase domain-containing protein [Pedobacter cryotolerans]|uniref:Acetylxylan esterase n=1 Tax=Pedobacter cryotolerans TaxID=2571270 RepID=A0A4U1BYA5_9SPHI|nr:acetylxylan esterase [Pedobacter cryotolerans]TKB96605.1 acetylxylan esterase [Pedobacter cryotolerans]